MRERDGSWCEFQIIISEHKSTCIVYLYSKDNCTMVFHNRELCVELISYQRLRMKGWRVREREWEREMADLIFSSVCMSAFQYRPRKWEKRHIRLLQYVLTTRGNMYYQLVINLLWWFYWNKSTILPPFVFLSLSDSLSPVILKYHTVLRMTSERVREKVSKSEKCRVRITKPRSLNAWLWCARVDII